VLGHNATGIYVNQGTNENNHGIEGCRIYNNGNLKHDRGIDVQATPTPAGCRNLIYQPTLWHYLNSDIHEHRKQRVRWNGLSRHQGPVCERFRLRGRHDLLQQHLLELDYAIQSQTANIGSCTNNLFYAVTSGREATTTTCTGALIKDPLFASTVLGDPNAFKLLPGSPASTPGPRPMVRRPSCATRTLNDLFGTARPVGSAPDIGLYEGTGYSANPTSEFDSLIASSTATTVTVYNAKWKVVFDKAKGGGISEFYDRPLPPPTCWPREPCFSV